MKPSTLERWIWVLLYGGGFAAMLGLWAMERDAALGWTLLGADIVAGIVGVVGIAWRARLDRRSAASR